MKILLDPGHGENTAGKRSPIWPDGSQLREWEFNRDIARRVCTSLRTKGADVELLVKEDVDVPLTERVRRANDIVKKVGKNNCLLISIHANAGGGTGWEAYTSIGQTLSDKYATVFYNETQNYFPGIKVRTDHSDGDPDKESQFYILAKTICPAVLTENFFMDTLKDCQYIMSESGRQTIANFHIESILKCLDL